MTLISLLGIYSQFHSFGSKALLLLDMHFYCIKCYIREFFLLYCYINGLTLIVIMG